MISNQQCELARLMTNSGASDEVINAEYLNMHEPDKVAASETIDKLLVLHNLPFDKGITLMQDDFASVSAEYGIDPATLFCVYMEHKS